VCDGTVITSVMDLVGAVPAEQKHEWTEGHRSMGPEILAARRNPIINKNQRDCAAINATGAESKLPAR
jgi:hypothetical protein